MHLYDVYEKDIRTGYITEYDAESIITDFVQVLHADYWYKSNVLLGDTGQIIILGGLDENSKYICNDLTYLFIQVMKHLRLPDPKVLLRVSGGMPNDLLQFAIECMGTGIGAPLLSNDDVVIPKLIHNGYSPVDACEYATSACWEPFIPGKSCDQNNVRTINFCTPFIKYMNMAGFDKCIGIGEIKTGYYQESARYLDRLLASLDRLEFEEDPLLTLFTPMALERGRDVVHGGVKYSNLGLTSVGLSSVVNSLLNIERMVFDDHEYTLNELNDIRKQDYEGYDNERKVFDISSQRFGCDDDRVLALTNEIIAIAEESLQRHRTKMGGRYKFGLSAPGYIIEGNTTEATLDGRKNGQPFAVNISGKNGITPTELMAFASRIDYNKCINGNVVDFLLCPDLIRNDIDKVIAMIKGGIKLGFYQLQINVVDYATLVAAKNDPGSYPDLVVRVWGFSTYFRDLPEEYQDNLIRRAYETEMAG